MATNTNSVSSGRDKIYDEYDKQAALVSALHSARDSLTHDSGSTDPAKLAAVQAQYKQAVDDLSDLNKKLQTIQRQTEQDLRDTSDSINKYRKTLNNNNKLFQQYSEEIKNNMQLVATRDRMLQLSQERNMYKKKVIYVLFSIIIALLIAVISAYSIFGKIAKK